MARIKKLVWFCPELNQIGGGARLILEGLKYFESVGIEAYLLVFNFNKRTLFDETYKPNVIEFTQESNAALANFFSRVIRQTSRILWLRKELKNIKPDIIITLGEHDNSIPLHLATLFMPFLYAVHVFGSVFTYFEFSKYAFVFRKHFDEIRESVARYKEVTPPKPPKISPKGRLIVELNAFLRYLSVRKAKKVFVLSKRNQSEVGKLYKKDSIVLKGAFPPQIFDYKPSVDMKERMRLAGKKVVLNINKLLPKKNVDLCIKAFKKIVDETENVALIIGGIGPEENRLKALVEQLDLRDKVKFAGYIKEKELWDYYASCDVFVHMDIADFDIAPYEVLALGRKVIWSTEMETDEFLKGNRFLFPTEPEVDALVKTIEKTLTTDLGAMESMEKTKLSHYTWDNYFGDMLKEMEKCL